MKEHLSLCPIFHGSYKHPERQLLPLICFDIVVVYDVLALVCDLCGTDWLEDSVAEKLALIVEQACIKHLVMAVANWQQEIQAR